MAGVPGVVFNRSLLFAIERDACVPAGRVIPAALITGSVVGLTGWFSPLMVGSGHALAESALTGDLLLAAIPLFFMVRFFS